jgi:SAM-dependent methyltransferase
VTFAVAADAYDRFMGRYSVLLAPLFADFAGIEHGQRVIDVGCGPGALSAELATRIGPSAVTAVDPTDGFVAAVRERIPGVDARVAAAERLPFAAGEFDAALAQLVVLFMTDPIAGLREMDRVTRRDGTVAACVWDHATGGRGPLNVFWQAARELDPSSRDESSLAGTREGDLAKLFQAAGIGDIEDSELAFDLEHETFEGWWEPYTLGVGPAGEYAAGLDEEQRERLRERCRALLPRPPFTLSIRAWAAKGLASSTGA